MGNKPAIIYGLGILLGSLGMSNRVTGGEYDRPAGWPQQSRSVVLAKNGMVATSHPLAAQVGLNILQSGGNAVDAAIAVNAMLGLVEPMSCGIGGDLFVIHWDAKTQKLYGLNASGRSPFLLNRDVLREKNLAQIPDAGPLSWSVPGCVDGWSVLQKCFGKQDLNTVLAPAVQYAKEGVPVPEVIASYWKAGEKAFEKWPDSAATYLIDGKAPRFGEVFKNPRLAATYQAIADQGRDAFYKGPIAEEIVKFSEAHGGYFQLRDFEEHTSTWVDPVGTNYRGYDVWELPPNGQGIAALEMLNILETYDLKKMGRQSADYLHLLIEAKKLAFADRAKFYADPEFDKLPIAELISKEYAAKQRERIDLHKAARQVPAGDPKLIHGDTVYLTVVDKDRNCCSFIQSNYYGFGSKVVPGNVGFVMQNRGALFALDESHHNRLEPHKRPFHTIIPAMVTKDGQPWFCFGVMGGDMQPQGHVQVLVNLIDFELNIQQAGDAARVRHIGSATPTGQPMNADGGSVAVESTFPTSVLRELRNRGHKVIKSPGGFGGYQGILIDWKNNTLQGATEPRKDGAVLGY